MEGLIKGIPVIAPDFGPFPYLVKNGVNGLLYQVDSVEDLGAKIANGLDDVELYERLRAGAEKTGRELRNARVNFYDAIKSAFEYSESGSTQPGQNTQ
jgi:glycosyltransferase involved in cell wall biosynthesis